MPTRHDVVVDLLAPRPDDSVVEVGCGYGVAATLVVARLTTGTYIGVDRSAAMIDVATARNREAVESGRASFVAAELEAADVGPCDRLFAARVRALATPQGLAVARGWLRPGGIVVLAIDAPAAARARAAAHDAALAVIAAGFSDVVQHERAYDGGALLAVTAVRS